MKKNILTKKEIDEMSLEEIQENIDLLHDAESKYLKD